MVLRDKRGLKVLSYHNLILLKLSSPSFNRSRKASELILSRDEKAETISFLNLLMPSKEETLEIGMMEEK